MRFMLLMLMLGFSVGCDPLVEDKVETGTAGSKLEKTAVKKAIKEPQGLTSVLQESIESFPREGTRPFVSHTRTDTSQRKGLMVDKLRVQFEPGPEEVFLRLVDEIETRRDVWVSRFSFTRARAKKGESELPDQWTVDGFELLRYRTEGGVLLELPASVKRHDAGPIARSARQAVARATVAGKAVSVDLLALDLDTRIDKNARCSMRLRVGSMANSVAVENAVKNAARLEFLRGQTTQRKSGAFEMEIEFRVLEGS